MSGIKNLISPKSASGSVLWSLGVHLAVAGMIGGYMGWKSMQPKVEEEYIDLAYETFDEPPIPEEKVQRVRNSPAPTQPVDVKAPQDNAPKELHDDTSDVAGTQKAKEESNIGSTSNGTAASTPYYKIKPKYPKAALLSGVEGWVLMEIDINEAGEVENIRVLDGEQRNMFQSEAKRAVAQWKYRPFVDGEGKPYRKADHQVRVEFKLEEAADSASM
jgi:TonB family protein